MLGIKGLFAHTIMLISRQLSSLYHRLLRDRRGAALPLIASATLVMLAALGGATDLARMYLAHSQMQAAVDAAALAGASAFDNKNDADPSGRRQQVIAYYVDNFSNTYMGVRSPSATTVVPGTTTLLEPSFVSAGGISRTVVRASGNVPMLFMRLFGAGTQPISAHAAAEFQQVATEVMVVLDNTGSMQEAIPGGSNRHRALQAAVKSFIDILYQGGTSRSSLALGMINYTNIVNVGSILQKAGVPIETVAGFNDWPTTWEQGNALAWKGCVANDDSIVNMSADLSVREADAHDIWNALPGERPRPTSLNLMRPIRPAYYPVSWVTNGGPFVMRQTSGSFINFFPRFADLPIMIDKPIYKRQFYKLFISLNDPKGAASDDVITEVNGSFYDPKLPDSFNWVTGTGRPFAINVNNIPAHIKAMFQGTSIYKVNAYNAGTSSPNWQCPEPGLPIVYDVPRKTYDDFVDTQVQAIQPAGGTIHHAGFIWGWRILSRYQWFRRTPPFETKPERALVFMTDGRTEASSVDDVHYRYYYGSADEGTIAPPATTSAAMMAASTLRFQKACAIAGSTVFQDTGKTAKIYVVAVTDKLSATDEAVLRSCGKDGFFVTTTAASLTSAFNTIGRSLTDIHLAQ